MIDRMGDSAMNFATIGTGWIVDTFVESAAAAVPKLTYAAAYSRNKETGTQFARKHGVKKVYTELSELAKDPEIDAVYIASPNTFHYEQAACMLRHGKHVLCEKTSVVTSRQLERLYEIAEASNCIFLEAIKGIYTPELAQIKRELPRLGEIHLALLDYSKYSSKYDSYAAGQVPNIFNPAMAAGGLMDMGIYAVYPAVYLFGVPDKICAVASFLRTGADVAGAQLFQYPDKTVVLSYSKSAQSGHDAVIMGSRGTLHIDSLESIHKAWIQWQTGEIEILAERPPERPPMGYEAECLYEFASKRLTEEKRCRYQQLQELTKSVIGIMERIRESAGIHFPDACFKV